MDPSGWGDGAHRSRGASGLPGADIPATVGPAAWFHDPAGTGLLRWFDGHAWTELTMALPDPQVPVQRHLRRLGYAAFVGLALTALLLVASRPWLLRTYDEALAFDRSADGSLHGDMISFSTDAPTGQIFMIVLLAVVIMPAIGLMGSWSVTARRHLRQVPQPGAVLNLLRVWLAATVVGYLGLVTYVVLVARTRDEHRAVANLAFVTLTGACFAGGGAVEELVRRTRAATFNL